MNVLSSLHAKFVQPWFENDPNYRKKIGGMWYHMFRVRNGVRYEYWRRHAVPDHLRCWIVGIEEHPAVVRRMTWWMWIMAAAWFLILFGSLGFLLSLHR